MRHPSGHMSSNSWWRPADGAADAATAAAAAPFQGSRRSQLSNGDQKNVGMVATRCCSRQELCVILPANPFRPLGIVSGEGPKSCACCDAHVLPTTPSQGRDPSSSSGPKCFESPDRH